MMLLFNGNSTADKKKRFYAGKQKEGSVVYLFCCQKVRRTMSNMSTMTGIGLDNVL